MGVRRGWPGALGGQGRPEGTAALAARAPQGKAGEGHACLPPPLHPLLRAVPAPPD